MSITGGDTGTSVTLSSEQTTNIAGGDTGKAVTPRNPESDFCFGCPEIEPRPAISLEEWRKSLTIPAFYFWQLGQTQLDYPNTPIPIDTGSPCETLVFESWSQGGPIAGRDEIYNTFTRIDARIRDYVGYWPRPAYSCEEIHFKKPYEGGSIRLHNAKIKALGAETWTILASDAMAIMTDDDGDGLLDKVTVTVPVVSGVNVNEIHILFEEPDWNKPDRYRNEIRPLKIKQVGAYWQITFPAWAFVRPILYSENNQAALDPNDSSIYATGVDVWRRWTNSAQAITILREGGPCSCGNTGDCYTCELGSGCILNAERGVIDIRTTNTAICRRCIKRVFINYLSGGDIDSDTLAHLYAGYLERMICCGVNETLKYWQADYVSVDAKGKIATTLTMLEKGNPFGTTRGAIDAFRFFRSRRARKAIRM